MALHQNASSGQSPCLRALALATSIIDLPINGRTVNRGERSFFRAYADVMVGQGRMKNCHRNLRHVALQAVCRWVDSAGGLRSVFLRMTAQAFRLVKSDGVVVVAMRVVASQATQLAVTFGITSAEREGQAG